MSLNKIKLKNKPKKVYKKIYKVQDARYITDFDSIKQVLSIESATSTDIFRTVHQYVEHKFKDRTEDERTFFKMVLLREAGMYVRLLKGINELLLVGCIEDSTNNANSGILCGATITYGDEKFALLAPLPPLGPVRWRGSYPIQIKGKRLFNLEESANLTEDCIDVEQEFYYKFEPITLTYSIDYSKISYREYNSTFCYDQVLHTPLSNCVKSTLIPYVLELVDTLDLPNAVMTIAAFGDAMLEFHGADSVVHGFGRFYTAEEALYYGEGDCEDNVALTFALIKEILQVPMVTFTINEESHQAMAVHIPGYEEVMEPSFIYNEMPFWYLDPSFARTWKPLGYLLIPDVSFEDISIDGAYFPDEW